MAAPLNYFAADPSVALANAQQVKGNTILDAWYRAQRQLLGLTNSVNTDRLNRSQGLANDSILSDLAARGLGRSGDVGYQLGQSALNFNDKRYDQAAPLVSRMANFTSQYLGKKQGLIDNTTGAYQGAFERAGQNPVPGATFPAYRPVAAPTRPAPSPYSYGGGMGR